MVLNIESQAPKDITQAEDHGGSVFQPGSSYPASSLISDNDDDDIADDEALTQLSQERDETLDDLSSDDQPREDDISETHPIVIGKIPMRVVGPGFSVYCADIFKLVQKHSKPGVSPPLPLPEDLPLWQQFAIPDELLAEYDNEESPAIYPPMYQLSAIMLVRCFCGASTANILRGLFVWTEDPTHQDWQECVQSAKDKKMRSTGPLTLILGLHQSHQSNSDPDLTELPRIYHSLPNNSGPVRVEIRDGQEVNLPGLIALICNHPTANKKNTNLGIRKNRAHILPKSKQFFKAMLNYVKEG